MENPVRSTVVTPGSFAPSLKPVAVPEEDLSAGVSWAAAIGGAFVIAALSLILLALGSGLGFASVSPWSSSGASAATIGAAAIVWLILMQLIASAMGGYLAGRLRTRWTSIHDDEVFFRDTAHGFLAWALAVVVTTGFLATAATSMLGGAAQLGATAMLNGNDYYVDTLFRSESPDIVAMDVSARAEALRTFANVVGNPNAPSADRSYLAKLVAARTGLGEPAAKQRVDETVVQSQQVLETARKAATQISIWTFVALLIGAFSASYAATIGGRQRDHVVAI